uniref:Uncharacterized protein n=1 Tax=Lactuca sativa TaxID=4236 RepID=A0A9R1WG65_LACSA|nr:hypothetical protein LSAT_V11C100044090 [Lactuca sativa]
MLFFVQHDSNNFNVKAIVNLKRSECNIEEVFDVLDGVRRDLFRQTIFGYLLDVPRLQGDELLFHKMFLHQIWSDDVLSLDGIKRLYFRVVSEKMVSTKNRCSLRECLFPNHTNSLVKIGDLKSYILNHQFLEVGDADAVRVCLIYILCEYFLGKEINHQDLEDTWNKINKYLSPPERRQTLKYSVLGFTVPFRIWIVTTKISKQLKLFKITHFINVVTKRFSIHYLTEYFPRFIS